MYVLIIKISVSDLFLTGQGRGHLMYHTLNSMALGGEKMLFKKIVELVEEHGWKQQNCGMTGISGSIGTNFYKDGKVLTVSIVEEGHMIYPDDDELKEMFGVL